MISVSGRRNRFSFLTAAKKLDIRSLPLIFILNKLRNKGKIIYADRNKVNFQPDEQTSDDLGIVGGEKIELVLNPHKTIPLNELQEKRDVKD